MLGSMDSQQLALDAALLDDPDDRGTLLVYADWLLARGDPRGELISLHDALRDERDPLRVKALRDAEAALRQRHRDRLLPPALGQHPGHRLRWASGFIRALELDLPGQLGDAELLRQVLEHPSLRYLTELQLSLGHMPSEPVLGTLVQVAPPALRTLRLGREGLGRPASIRLGELDPLVRLDCLVLHEGTRWERPTHPQLRRLELVQAPMVLWDGERRASEPEPVLQILEDLDPARLPALRALRVSGLDGRRQGRLSHALSSLRLALGELVLDRCSAVDELCAVLVRAPWRQGLATLALSDTMTLAGAEILAGSDLALEQLDVSGNRLPEAARGKLEPRCKRLVFGWQQP